MSTTHSRSTEHPASTVNGILMLLLGLALILAAPLAIGFDPDNVPKVVAGFASATVGLILICGLYALQPNEGMAIMLFGAYRGTDRKTGLRWVLPWYSRKKISLRVRNLTSDKLKVNDKRGSPIEIAAKLSARRLIVKGAVGMVESALADLNERGVVDLDEDRKAAMVSNLLAVLCADREAQPVVNTGTLYG